MIHCSTAFKLLLFYFRPPKSQFFYCSELKTIQIDLGYLNNIGPTFSGFRTITPISIQTCSRSSSFMGRGSRQTWSSACRWRLPPSTTFSRRRSFGKQCVKRFVGWFGYLWTLCCGPVGWTPWTSKATSFESTVSRSEMNEEQSTKDQKQRWIVMNPFSLFVAFGVDDCFERFQVSTWLICLYVLCSEKLGRSFSS